MSGRYPSRTAPQPRDHPVACALCAIRDRRRPVMTWAASGLCVAHESQAT